MKDFSFDAWVRDLETVVDALGLDRFPLLGISQGGPVAITYAVRHPERVSHLILYGTYAKGTEKRELTPDQIEEGKALLTLTGQGWGRANPAYRQIFTTSFIPEASAEQMRWFNDLQRESTSPDNAVSFLKEFWKIDVVDLLPQVSVPTLVLHARDDGRCPFEEGRKVAAAIADAHFVPLESRNHILLEDEPAWETFLAEVRRFLGIEEAARPVRLPLAAHQAPLTILFTDMEGSTDLTQRLGDAKAQEVLRTHNAIIRDALSAHSGREIKHTGDGIMASFSTASRALEAAIAIQRGFREHNRGNADGAIRVRIGLNAGEPIAEDEDLFGTAVIEAARITAAAQGGQILVANVVRELVKGKDFLFADRGETSLRGFEDPVRLFEVRWRES